MDYKISFCTVCMNRLHHLRQTLPKNIKDNIAYPNIEFIVMDYSSTDGLSDWIKDEMLPYIDSGILVYYRYEDADYFDRGHSRNMMFKLADGEIICNVDADNYLGENFAHYVNSVFQTETDVFLIPDTKKKYYYIRDALGRFCTKKEDFLTIKGYDEKMNGYGFEDDDLYERLANIGKKEIIIRDLNYLNAIKHENKDRVENEFFINYLDSLYIYYESLEKSHVVILYKNQVFNKGVIHPGDHSSPSPAIIENFSWTTGTWKREDRNLILQLSNSEDILEDHQDFLAYKNQIFYKIKNAIFKNQLPYHLPLITNYSHFLNNKQNRSTINSQGFGIGTVYKNFSSSKIQLDLLEDVNMH